MSYTNSGSSSSNGVDEFGKMVAKSIKQHDANTFWEKGNWSAGKDGVRYGEKTVVGGDGLQHTFNNGGKVYGKPTDFKGSWEAGVKFNW